MTADPPDPRIAAAQQRAQQRATRYDAILREVAAGTGGILAGDGELEVANSVKSIEALREKTARSTAGAMTVDEALLETRDLNRYTILFEKQDYVTGVQRAEELLAERGFTFAYQRNAWEDPFYLGYNVGLEDSSLPHPSLDPNAVPSNAPRQPVELQFHTPESFQAKQDTHAYYEVGRAPDAGVDDRVAADELQARRNERLERPPGYEQLGVLMPPRERPDNVPEDDVERVRRRAATLRAEREVRERQELPPTLPEPEAGATLAGSNPRGPPRLPESMRRHMTHRPTRSSNRDRWEDLDRYRDQDDRGGAGRG